MPEKRTTTSLAHRLNAALFFRQLRTMLWLDIVIGVMFAAALVYYTETAAIAQLADYTAVSPYGVGRNRATGFADAVADGQTLYRDAHQLIYRTTDKPEAFYLSDIWQEYVPPIWNGRMPAQLRDRNLGRSLSFGEAGLPWVERAEQTVYQLVMDVPGGWLVSASGIGFAIGIFLRLSLVLLIMEGFSLLFSIGRNGRSIRKTLKPLQALADSARAITTASTQSGPLSPEVMRRLTGALASIHPGHLDAGLPLAGISNELKPLAEAINAMLARIDEAYREQVRFVSDASHELRTPIAVIQGYADLLSRWGTEDPETMRESIAAIRQEAVSMKDLVEQLLFLARGESDVMHIEWKAVDVSALGAEVLREIEMIHDTHRFSAEIQPAVHVDGDDGKLKQLMRILMDNAVKYTPQGGRIILRVERGASWASVSVQDEGAGIAERDIPYIFDRFYRADESRTRGTGGAGLGLSIAKWIAQRHHGSIEVTSRENIGTRMTVRLPLGNASAENHLSQAV